ncbi:type VI secretion system protein TssL, long form [Cellvibrio sp.]
MLDIDSFGVNTSRTFVVPNPGGRAKAIAEPAASNSFFNESDEVFSGSNPILAVANPILNMIYQVRTLVHNPDPSQLRNYLIEEIKKFEARAKAEAISPEHISAARYCLCTVIDETAAQTPWGGGGVWPRYSLLVTFHNETWGGEKFFQILARVSQTPALHRDLIELMFFCISLGFEGRYKVVPNGHSQLELLRRRLAEIIADVKGEKVKTLSPHWMGFAKPRSAIWTLLPVWVSMLLCVIAGAVLFVSFALKLSDYSDSVFSQVVALPIPEVVVTSPEPVSAGQISLMLKDEVDKHLVSVKESSGVAVVTLMGDGLFESGSVTINSNYLAVIKKIADAVQRYGKSAVVSGHTDNVPIRTARFPSNWHLSLDRARSVASYLQSAMVNNRAIDVQGLGDAEPIATNSTTEGRSLNRRVEVKILLRSAKY